MYFLSYSHLLSYLLPREFKWTRGNWHSHVSPPFVKAVFNILVFEVPLVSKMYRTPAGIAQQGKYGK